MRQGSRKHIPLSTRLFLTFALLAFAASATAGVILYFHSTRALRNEVQQHLMSIASTTAAQIDADVHKTIRTRVDEDTPEYRQIESTLASAKRANPKVRFIYTLRKSKRAYVLRFVVEAEDDPKNKSHVGDVYDPQQSEDMLQAFSGPIADRQLTTDDWGTWLSGYAPIEGSDGQADAIVGVDMSVDELRNRESALRIAAVLNCALALALALLLGLIAARTISGPIDVLVRSAQRVRNGDLDFHIVVPSNSEASELASAFNDMIDGLKENRERLIEGSSKDFLTGLYNHMYFHQAIESEIQRAARYGHKLCVLMMDLDRFKSVNDTLGHPIGDSIIRQLATILRQALREVDVAVRYGGDEFAVILPETEKDEGLYVAERIRSAVEDYVFQAVPLSDLAMKKGAQDKDKSIHLTVTVGVACFPDDDMTKDGLIMAADSALCRAKSVRRNSVEAFDESTVDAGISPNELYQVMADPDSNNTVSLTVADDSTDRRLFGHSERVAEYAKEIAQAISADEQTINALVIAGLLHDLGKIGGPESVLNKAGSLTQGEREQINEHPSVGGEILKHASTFDQIIPAVICHHERWDGSGYPDGLAGEQIPLLARIIGIADAFDAMTSNRPYRKAMTVQQALLELRAGAGKQFDPSLVEVFIARISSQSRDAA